MKNFSIKAISLMLAILLVVPCFAVMVSADEGTPFTYIKGANNASSAYKSSKFYSNLHKLTITGDQRTDLVAVALTQAGYFESNSTSGFGGTTPGTKNFTEYNYNMGDFGSGYGDGSAGAYHWCASFVSWCILQSQVYSIRKSSMGDWCRSNKTDKSYIWREVSCNQWTDQLERAGYFRKSKNQGGTYVPQTGDLIFFTYNQTSAGHIGIVIYTDGTYVYTVEGNTNDQNGLETNGNCVAVKKYALSSSYIFAYGAMPYKEKAESKIDFSGKNKTTGLYMNTDANKYIFPDKSCSSGTHIGIISRFTIFETVEVCSNGNLKVVATLSDGSTKTGYIDPAASAVYQLTSTAAPANAIEIENNVASGKKYTTSKLYRQGGEDVSWAYDETKPINYDDENGESLTDELISLDANYEDVAWAGLHYNTPDAAQKGYAWVTVDLADEYSITECQLYVPSKDFGSGVSTPNYVSFWGSMDGVNYKQIGVATVTPFNDGTAIMSVKCNTVARYVEARISHGGWCFVNEIAVIGTVWDGVTLPEENEPETSEPETSVPETSVPDVSEPEESVPDVSEPEVSEPEVSEPEVSEPEVSEPEVSEPEVSVPETSEPETSEPEESIPEPTEYNISFAVNGNGVLNVYDFNNKLISETKGSDDYSLVEVKTIDDISFTFDVAEGWALLGTYVDGEMIELEDINYLDVETVSTVEIFLAPIPKAPDVDSIKMNFTLNSDGETYTGEITPILNAVYSFNGITFTEDNIKPKCYPLTEYTLYVKIVDYDNNLESEVVSVKITSPGISYVLGDVNENDTIDMTDYILLKRNYFGTYEFDDDAILRGDINKNNKIDMTDYVLLKRMYFGTYTAK